MAAIIFVTIAVAGIIIGIVLEYIVHDSAGIFCRHKYERVNWASYMLTCKHRICDCKPFKCAKCGHYTAKPDVRSLDSIADRL